jgi:hypothetical protein
MRLVCSFLIFVTSIGLIACGPRKPAYDSINSNQAAATENKNSSEQPSPPPAAPGSEGQQAGGQTPPSLQPEKFRMPPFLDQATGQIKDLPSYPLADRVNIQYGPLQGQDTATLTLVTGDAMDNIVAFYEKTIKSNGWTVSDKLHDQDVSNWTLKKGKGSEGKVEVRKDPQSKKMYIVIARTQAQAQPQPQQ